MIFIRSVVTKINLPDEVSWDSAPFSVKTCELIAIILKQIEDSRLAIFCPADNQGFCQ